MAVETKEKTLKMNIETKNIRLTEEEIKAIKDTAKEIFGNNVEVWLFGSRVNPKLKGGY